MKTKRIQLGHSGSMSSGQPSSRAAMHLPPPRSREQCTDDNAAPIAATAERESDCLLTVQQVAELLQVPVSWVYGRTRTRSTERLPGIRLGKYWRFREEEIRAWVERQRGGQRAA